VTREYQICLKCHSDYAYTDDGVYPVGSRPNLGDSGGSTPSGTNGLLQYTNQAMEFQAPLADMGETGGNHRSWHPVINSTGRSAAARNMSASTNLFLAPWDGANIGSQTMYCSDCHGTNTATGTAVPSGTNPWGPHGSTNDFILKGSWDQNTGNNNSGLCFRCHNHTNYATDVNEGDRGGFESGFGGPDRDTNLHAFHAGAVGTNLQCSWCHVAVPHGWKNKAFLVNLNDVGPEAGLPPGTEVDITSNAQTYSQGPYYMNAKLRDWQGLDAKRLRDAAMMRIVSSLASLKLTLAGLVGAIVVALMSSASPGMDIGFIVIPLALLSINLLAAITTNKAFRVQVPLLIFHICLLAGLLLVGIGVLIRFEGHVELVEGEDFNASAVQVTRVGAMHPSRMNDISFTQREIEVSFLPGLLRRDTRSVVSVEESGRAPQDIILNDQTSMTMDGYRFIPTFNKGFAVIVVWSDADGRVQRGAVNFPSFPKYEWKQVNTWMAPGGEKIRFELKLPATDRREQAWVLRSRNLPFSVEIDHGRMAPRGFGSGICCPDRAGDSLSDKVLAGKATLAVENFQTYHGT
jgi:hypothetical protein